MNRKTTLVALLIALTNALTICHAQQIHTVAFSYDVDGNRITREILFGRMGGEEKSMEANEEFLSSITDHFETIRVSLYPNPTNDKFFVEIKGETSEKADAMLTHISGAVLEKRTLTNSVESFDLSGLASGLYLFKLTMKNETHIWKVIKKQ